MRATRARTQRVIDNNADGLDALYRLEKLRQDNQLLAARLGAARKVCKKHGDIGTISLIEVCIDEGKRRRWCLMEATEPGTAARRGANL